MPQLLCAFPQAQYFSLGFLAKFFVPFLSQYCLFALVFFSSQIAEVVTEPIPRASDSREREEGLSNLLPLLHRPQSTLHRCSRPQPPDLTTAQRNGRAKENGNNGNSGNPGGLVADRSEPLAFFLCGLLVSYVCGGDLPSLTAIVRSLLLRYFFASLVVPFFVVPYFAIPIFPFFFSVVRSLRHFGLCYALAPLLSRTITISGTFVAYPCSFVVPLFHCSSAGGRFLCLDWYFPLPHLNFLFVLVGVPVLELGAQFIQFWSLELNSTCQVFLRPFFLSCFFLNFFFIFYLFVVFKNVFSCFSPKNK